MSLELHSTSYPHHPTPPSPQGTSLWPHPPPQNPFLLRIPAKIFYKITSYILLSKPHSTSHKKQIIFTLSSTCSIFHDFFRDDLYFSISIRSAKSLKRFTTYLSTHSWRSQCTAIKFLTLRWPQEKYDCVLATPLSRHEASQNITLNLKIILETYTEKLQSLTLDFPGAGISFQTAILTAPALIRKRHLKSLHITNGLCPLLQPPTFILCAVSTLCARSIEELIIDIACDVVNESVSGFYPNKLHVPGRQMFCAFEKLQRLRKLDVKGVKGFTDGCLAWALSGSQLSYPRKKDNVLILERCQGLTNEGVERILSVVESGLERVRIASMKNESTGLVLEEFSSIPTPETWLSLNYGDELSSKTDNGTEFSFIYDNDSMTDIVEGGSTISGTIYEDEIFHLDISGDFDMVDHSSNKYSYRHHHTSYKSTYSYHSTPVYQSPHDVHICDITSTACQHLSRLDVPTSNIPYPSLDSHYNHRKENRSRNSYSTASTRHPAPTYSDKDAEYINHHLFSRTVARASAPVVHPLPKPVSLRSSYSSSPILPSSAPVPGFSSKGLEKLAKPRGDLKFYKPTDEAAIARGFKFTSLRGFWEGVGSVGSGRRWFKCRK